MPGPLQPRAQLVEGRVRVGFDQGAQLGVAPRAELMATAPMGAGCNRARPPVLRSHVAHKAAADVELLSDLRE